MNLIQFLLKASWRSVLAAAIAGAIGGLCSAAAIGTINQSYRIPNLDFRSTKLATVHKMLEFTVKSVYIRSCSIS
jgi:hypothetical protein